MLEPTSIVKAIQIFFFFSGEKNSLKANDKHQTEQRKHSSTIAESWSSSH